MNVGQPSPTRAVSVAIIEGGRFLLVRRGRPPALDLYAFPGGRVERGETLIEAVQREAMEETGARLANVRHVVDLEIEAEEPTRHIEFVLSVHAADFAGGDIAPGDDAAETIWVTLDDMAALPLAESVMAVARQLVER